MKAVIISKLLTASVTESVIASSLAAEPSTKIASSIFPIFFLIFSKFASDFGKLCETFKNTSAVVYSALSLVTIPYSVNTEVPDIMLDTNTLKIICPYL